MRSFRYFLFAIVLAAGCKSMPNDGYAIDFRLTFDSSVSDAELATLTTLHLDVSGAETFATNIATAGKLSGRTGGLRYKPGAQSGMLQFTFIAAGASGPFATGSATVTLKPGTQVIDVPLVEAIPQTDGGRTDGGIPLDMALCGNGVVDPGETCDPGAASPTPCPASVADCDDKNDCTTDSLSGSACAAACAHVPVANGVACGAVGDGGTSGVCQSGACCKGCISNGACVAGTIDTRACGSSGNACVDCTQFSASATCAFGLCSGCDATSCTTEGRLCGSSSCGYNCGACADSCMSGGTLTHYTCLNKSCAPVNPPANCGLYSTCASATACSSGCSGDGNCISTAYCDSASGTCKAKGSIGASCSAEGAGDRECASNVCSWRSDGQGGYCTASRCAGCVASSSTGKCDALIQYGKDPRHWCVFINECESSWCSGYPPAYYGAMKLGTENDGCDTGANAIDAPRACGATATCSAGNLKGGFCQLNSSNVFVCDTNSGDSEPCTACVGGFDYSCPCAGNTCTSDLAQCTKQPISCN